MRMSRALLATVVIVASLSCSSAGSYPTVSASALPAVRQIAGKAVVDNPDEYRLEMDTSKSTWSVDDPGSKIFKTKSGKYVVKVNTTSLLDGGGAVVAILKNFNPETTKAGEHGAGDALETARIIDWNVLS